MDLLSGVETMEELKEVFAKDGAELSEPEAERLFQLLQHTRQLKKVTLDIDEFTLVNGGRNSLCTICPTRDQNFRSSGKEVSADASMSRFSTARSSIFLTSRQCVSV